MHIKNAEFDANFESIEKVAKKFTRRKLEGLCLQYYKVKKYQISTLLC
jgi:hypothetical protein